MQIPAIAKDFLMMHLPDDLKNKIDYTTLEVLPETFIDEKLRRSQVDALFKVQHDSKDLLIYVLIEQQSKPDYTMPTSTLAYKSDIWAAYLETLENKTKVQLMHKGIEQGKFDKSIEIAQRMIEEGYDVACISRVTKLLSNKIKALQKKKSH